MTTRVFSLASLLLVAATAPAPGASWASALQHRAAHALQAAAERDAAERYASLLKDCEFTYAGENIAAGVTSLPVNELEAELEISARRTRLARKLCLERIKPEVEDHKGRKADLAQRIANSDAEVARSLKAAWAEFNANPAKYLAPVLEDAPMAGLSAMLERARAGKPLAAACGSFSGELPPMNAGVAEAPAQRTAPYRACPGRGEPPAGGTVELDAGVFRAYAEKAGRMQPYTCSVKRWRNCLPDEAWARLGRVVTRENLLAVERAAALKDKLADEAKTASQRVNDRIEGARPLRR